MKLAKHITEALVVGSVALGGATVFAKDAGAGAKSLADVRIAIVTRDFNNPYWAALRDGAVAEGKAQGVTVTVRAGENETDSQGENAQISTLSHQNYNCYGVVPVNATNVITPLVPIAKQGIPILNLDTEISPSASKQAGVSYATFIGSDNLDAGEQAGKNLLKAMGGKGKVIILQGIAGEQNGINRVTGFKKVTDGKLDIVAMQPADYSRAKGLTVATALLQAHPDVTGIFAANDTMGLGAAQAVKNAGLQGKVKIISVDGIQAMLKSIKDGTNTGTITQYPYAEGQMAVQACIALVHEGKKIPARVVAPIKYINAENVDQAIASFPRPFVPYTDPFGEPKATK